MKKSFQTAATAAMFAAAMGTAMTNMVPPTISAAGTMEPDPMPWETTTSTITMTTQPAYGTQPITRDDPRLSTEEWLMTTTSRQNTTVVLYGPPWVFYDQGDLNMDNNLDARDLSLLKAYLLSQDPDVDQDFRTFHNGRELYPERLGDFNSDGKVDKEDVKAMVRELTGKPENEEPIVTTTTTTQPKPGTTTATITTQETLMDITETFPQDVYGPPEWFTEDPRLTTTTGIPQGVTTTAATATAVFPATKPVPKDTEPQDVYGPPNFFDNDHDKTQ